MKTLKMLVIAPLHDLPTYQSSRMAWEIFDLLNEVPGLYLRVLAGIFTNVLSIKSALQAEQWDFIVYFGHGLNESWIDAWFGTSIFVDLAPYMHNAIVYSMACYSGSDFGDRIIQAGAQAYIGNIEVVWGAYNASEHKYAIDFARPHQNEVLNLLRGVSVEDTVNFAKIEWNNLARWYKKNPENLKMASFYVDKAFYNGEHHVWKGNRLASLPPVITKASDLDLKALERNQRWL